jgi:hypothetical protein
VIAPDLALTVIYDPKKHRIEFRTHEEVVTKHLDLSLTHSFQKAANDNRNDGPAFERQQGNTVTPLESHQALVIRNAGVFPEAGAYGFVAAVGFADLFSAPLDHTAFPTPHPPLFKHTRR